MKSSVLTKSRYGASLRRLLQRAGFESFGLRAHSFFK
jgi:hypothetical protein